MKNSQPVDGPESITLCLLNTYLHMQALTVFCCTVSPALFPRHQCSVRSLSPSQARSQSPEYWQTRQYCLPRHLRRSQPFQTLPSGLTPEVYRSETFHFQYRLEYRSLRFSDHIFLWTHTARCRDAERIIFFDNNTTMTSADTILAISVASAAPITPIPAP